MGGDYWNDRSKHARKKRLDLFRKEWFDLIAIHYDVQERDNDCFTVHTEEFGIMDFYPKSNKLLFRSKNKWRDRGLQFIIIKLLEPVNAV